MKKNKLPKFSVIIGSYNTKKYLKLTIESVLNQTFQNFEVIIIDDGSNDGTDKIIKDFASKDKRIRPFYFKKNSGKDSVPKNFGIKKARGDYICFLDSDDLWHENKLSIQNDCIKKNTILVSTSCRYIDEKGQNYTSLFTHYFRKFLQNWFFKKGLVGFYMYNPVIFSSVMIKTEIMKKYMLNEKSEFVGIIDYELWLRLFKDSNNTRASIRAIHCVTQHFIERNSFKHFHIFLIGIGLRVLRTIMNYSYFKIRKVALSGLVLIKLFNIF